MVLHALLSFYRSLARHRLYAALNVLGLAAGVAVFLTLLLVVRYESSFDRWLPRVDHVWRLDSTWSLPGETPYESADASYVALPLLRADFPQIRAGAREFSQGEPVMVGDVIDSEKVSYVDPGFLDVLELPLLTGDRRTALSRPGNVVIDQHTAEKYFGTPRAVGRTLSIDHDGVRTDYTVAAVMRDLPPNTTLKLSILTPLTPAIEQGQNAFHSWNSDAGPTYLRFASSDDAASVAAGLRDFIIRRGSGHGGDRLGSHPEQEYRLSLVPLGEAHFHDVDIRTPVPGVDRRVVLALAAVGVLALLIAAVNTVNLATARAGLRAREVALRKVMGASRLALLVQFLGESTALVALATLIGLALTELAVPVLNDLGGWSVRIDYDVVLPWLALVVLVVGIGSGLYPALLLASYRPATVLASSRQPSGGRLDQRLRSLLVLTQFVCAIAFGICTIVIDAQSSFLRRADRGFDRQGLILVTSFAARELQPLQNVVLDAFRRVPGVTSVTVSDREPDSASTSNEAVIPPGWIGPPPTLIYEIVGKDYFRTYGVRPLAGRLFDDAHGNDDAHGKPFAGQTLSTIINRKAASLLGYADPMRAVGHRFDVEDHEHLTIIGVVQDVRFMSPRDPVQPQFYLYDTSRIDYAVAAVRFSGVTRAEILSRLQAAWHSVAPGQPFRAETADERLADFYRPDQQRARLFSVGAVLALAIAAIGLYGLAAFGTARRLQEIGIRKVLGATSADMLLLLVGHFVRPVLLANLIAWPIAWAVMRIWLSGFDQRIALSPGYFLGVGAAALAIAVLTVLGQALPVARAEPARALRHE